MSRRYGRKQRRAARDRIEVLETVYQWACDTLDSERSNRAAANRNVEFLLDRIRLWDSEIRGLLGPYTSFAIDEPTYQVDSPDQIRQMQVIPPMRAVGSPHLYSMEETVSYQVETMLGFMCGLNEEYLARLRRLLTVRVMVGREAHGEAAYFAISEEQWRQMKQDGPNSPGLERFIHRIAGDLVRLLVAPPKKKPSGDDLVPSMERKMRKRGEDWMGQ